MSRRCIIDGRNYRQQAAGIVVSLEELMQPEGDDGLGQYNKSKKIQTTVGQSVVGVVSSETSEVRPVQR